MTRAWMNALLSVGAMLALGRVAVAQQAVFTPITEVVERGEGERAMVLVPDFAADASVWAGFMNRHEDAWRMLAVTIPGFGGTEPPPDPGELPEFGPDDEPPTPWLDNAVEALAEVIEGRGLDRPIVIGHGLGALLGFRLALGHPDLVGGLVAIDGTPATLLYPEPLPRAERTESVTGSLLAQFARMSDGAWRERMRAIMMDGVTDPDQGERLGETASETPREVGQRYLMEYHLTDLTWRTRELAAPVLFIAAAGDVPVERVRGEARLHRAWYAHTAGLRDAELVFVPGARHFVMLDRPERVDELVDRFAERARGVGGERPGRSPVD